MQSLKKIVPVFMFFSLAGCTSGEVPPPLTVYFFPSRPAVEPQAAQSITDPEQGLNAAIDDYKAGNYESAILSARRLAEQYPGTPWYKRSLFVIEQALIGLDRPDEADAAMRKVQNEYPEMAEYAVMMAADYHFSGKRFSRAAALYEHVAERYPESPLAARAFYLRTQSLLGASSNVEAAEVLEAFLSTNAGSELAPDAWLALAHVLSAEGKTAESVQAYRNLWVRHPGTPAAQEAAKALTGLSASGIGVEDWSGDEWLERARNLVRTGQHESAVAAYKKTLEKKTDSANRAEFLFRIGVSQYYTGKRNEAAATLEKMVREHPQSHRVPEALFWTGRSYFKLGEREQGVAKLRKLVNAFPRSEWADDALYLIGNIYRDAADTRKASAFYSRLAADYPDSRFSDSAIWWNAWSSYTGGEYRKVERTLQELVNRYPRSFLVHQARYWQGRAAEKAGSSAKAADYYAKVLKRGRYTYYGYLAAERLAAASGLNSAIPAPDAGADVIPVECEEDCLDNAVLPESDEGPPVWTEETQRLLAEEPSFIKALELMHLELKKEAAAELWHIQDKLPRRPGAVIGLSKAFFELGDYYRSLILVLRSYERYLDGEVRAIPSDLWLLAYPQGYWDSIVSYSRKYRQDPYFVASIIRQESRFQPGALSPAGARGMMQVMPETGDWIAQSIKIKGFDRAKLFESDTAINLGTWYIGHLMKRFKGDALLVAAAYNAGPAAVAGWISKSGGVMDRDEFVESIPFAETRSYVKKVVRNYSEYKRIYAKTGQDGLGVQISQGETTGVQADGMLRTE